MKKLLLVIGAAIALVLTTLSSTSATTKYPYEVAVCWHQTSPDYQPGTYSFPQTYFESNFCDNIPEQACEPSEYQGDHYWIRDEGDEQLLEHLMQNGLDAPNGHPQDSPLEPHNYASFITQANPDLCAPPPPPPPVTPPHHPKKPHYAKVRVHKIDRCNCYFDKVWLSGNHHKVTWSKRHTSRLTWKFTVRGKMAPNGTRYLLPSRVGGHQGWAPVQVYTVHTTNKTCPCVKRGDCHKLYPNFHPVHHCRGKCS